MNNGGGLPEGMGSAGWKRQRGENEDNHNSIINKIQFKKEEKENQC